MFICAGAMAMGGAEGLLQETEWGIEAEPKQQT